MDETQGLDCLLQDEIRRHRFRQRKRYARFIPTQRAEYIQKSMQNRKRKRNAHYTPPNTNHCCEFSNGKAQNPSPNSPMEDNLMESETIGQRLQEVHLSQPHELRTMANCQFCQGKRFQYEPPTFCYHNGEVVLTSPSVPLRLRNLFTSQTVEALEFCKHIRAYNSIFGFTSFGVTLDKGLANSTGGVYTFRAQGQIYHELPSLIPSATSPCYFQLYFYDTDNELQNRGEVGWHQNILRRIQARTSNDASDTQNDSSFHSFKSAEDIFRQEQEGVDGSDTKKVSCREYYCYKLQIRDADPSVLLLSGRLLQQYVVDMYIKLENTRLDYYRQKQSDIRAELYQGVVDSVLAGESRGSMVGKRVVLPGSFVGGPRDMRRRYLDAIALVQRFGKPDLFITVTCNPDWKEIKDSLKQGQLAQDRPDLTARVFRAKLQDLKDQLFKKSIFGKVAAHVHAIEFQKRVKYLYKYIYKGHDKIVVDINHNEGDVIIDEIKQFQDARWVSAQEAMWRIFEFELYEMYPSVINLPLHLPNKQTVPYGGNQNLENIINSDTASRTMLTEFFKFCLHDKEKTPYLYREFPEYFVWNRKGRYWSKRKTRAVIGRINSANPVEGERYYLWVLLNHVRRPTSYADLLTVNGVKCSSFKEAAEKRGLLQTDNWLSECLADAASFQMPQALRHLFAVILVYCDPSNVRKRWQDYYEPMSEDFLRLEGANEELRLLKTLKSIDLFLESIGKSIKDYDLPAIKSQIVENESFEKREVLDELAVKNPPEDCLAPAKLNSEQKYAYNIILDHVNNNKNGSDFLLRVGNGVEPTVDENIIEIPEDMIVRYEGRSCESCLINAVFPSLKENANSAEYITQRAILATRNESVDMLNEKLIATFLGEEWKYVSYDKAIDDTHC
ncbi:hypothetical protein RHGRI_001464 [Rhododendron griersonianum]|uniref:Helitron helicase-like domain-containing protein n=1 Tax=Rhododendron griersonianum TaxID=479676 RepID=A0AAV6LLB3_9ERIC|nr:hypothetical protein RHGRI_001464 [Rhododendron griersonianum]